MTKEEILNMFEDSKTSKKSFSTIDVINLIEDYGNTNLEMDRVHNEYYYSLKISELIKQDIPLYKIQKLKDDGWTLDETKDNLVIFLI